MQAITLTLPGILDPRARASARPSQLAPRRDRLQGTRLLLFDNGKLHRRYGHNAVIFQTVAQRLQSQYGVQECQRFSRDLLSMPLQSVRDLAHDIAGLGVDGVILALCDSGVTAYTIVLAWELERQGLPTVSLCSGQTIHLAASMSLPVMPGLPLSQLNILRHSSPADIAAEVQWILGEVVDAFTTDPESLRQQFQDRYAPGDTPLHPDAAGELPLWSPHQIRLSDPNAATVTYDPAEAATTLYETFCEQGMCDGLPLIPPTRAGVEAMLRFCDRAPEDVLIPYCFPSGLPLTIRTLAINAVMAGCRPEYFPILQTAAEAVAEPQYRLMQGNITSHPSGNAIIVSGPLAQEIGLASAGGCLGPGFRANMTIGRALNLSLLNVARALPDKADLSTLGSPAELTLCCAENIAASPWSPFHEDLFDAETTSVTVLKCEGPHNVLDHLSTTPEGLLRSIADVAATLGGNNAYVPAELLILLNPEHARLIHAAGWGKADVQRYVFEQARNPRQLLAGRGITPIRPQEWDNLDDVPVVLSPEHVLVLVAGTVGPHSMVGIPWGFSRAVSKPVTLRDGKPARRVAEFQSR
jgi:hypothetical protein